MFHVLGIDAVNGPMFASESWDKPLLRGVREGRGSIVDAGEAKLCVVVIFFEVLLALASVMIAWFSVYVVYRLVTDES